MNLRSEDEKDQKKVRIIRLEKILISVSAAALCALLLWCIILFFVGNTFLASVFANPVSIALFGIVIGGGGIFLVVMILSGVNPSDFSSLKARVIEKQNVSPDFCQDPCGALKKLAYSDHELCELRGLGAEDFLHVLYKVSGDEMDCVAVMETEQLENRKLEKEKAMIEAFLNANARGIISVNLLNLICVGHASEELERFVCTNESGMNFYAFNAAVINEEQQVWTNDTKNVWAVTRYKQNRKRFFDLLVLFAVDG